MPRDLIIVRAGARSLHPFWKEPASEASWDIYVCPYQAIPDMPPLPGVVIGEIRPGQKWTGLSYLLKSWSGWRDYRYVVLADDDLMMTEATVTGFFERCVQLGAQLAQPALAPDSYASHLVVMRNSEFAVRQVTFVEVMLPCFRADVLADLLWTLDLTETGYGFGLDSLWPKLLGYQDLYIVDHLPVFHTRAVGVMRDEETERSLRAEEEMIMTKYDCALIRQTVSGWLKDGRRIEAGDPSLFHRLVRGYDWLFERQPELLPVLIRDQLAEGPKPS
jgi:hypothetical protein